jgi:hypothetical protein
VYTFPDNARWEIALNAYIWFFLLFGACFGAISFSRRHWFSEGPQKPAGDNGATATMASRLFWVMVCTFLWPIMLLTGLNSALILAKRKSGPSHAKR